MTEEKTRAAEQFFTRREIDPVYGMIEPVPDAKYWNHPLSIRGRANHLSWCLSCGATNNWIQKNFHVPISRSTDCCPICFDCGEKMTIEQVLGHLKRHSDYSAQFYPMEFKGELFYHQPINLVYAEQALRFWLEHKRDGENPSETWRRRRMDL